MDIKYAKYKYDLDWGEITKEDILQKLYFGKSIKDMNEEEMNQIMVFRTLLKSVFEIFNRCVWLCV